MHEWRHGGRQAWSVALRGPLGQHVEVGLERGLRGVVHLEVERQGKHDQLGT